MQKSKAGALLFLPGNLQEEGGTPGRMAMEKKKMLFIYNPKAGKAKIRNYLLDIIDIFTKTGYEVTAYPTQAKGDGLLAVL